MLAWIDNVAEQVSEYKGRPISRADVIRWMTRRARRDLPPYDVTDLARWI